MPDYEQNAAGKVFADGPYEFECVDAGEKTAGSGNTMIELQLDCLSPDFTDKVRVVDRLVFTPNSYWKIDSFRRATGEKITQNQKVSFEAENCIDRKGRLVLKTSSYNGNLRNEVDYYVEPEPGAAQQPSMGPAPGPVAPAPQQTPKGTVPKSDIPF
jgi:hypothetical protein